jgi:hypothetical protein
MSIYVEIDMSVDEEGGLRLRSGAQRFHEGPISFAFPMLFSGIADVRRNETWGPLFGYHGSFEAEWLNVASHTVPANIAPRRQERRE